jgi:hypothetical protein
MAAGLFSAPAICCSATSDFRDQLLFHEYYHGETGAGLGASHQTGWSGLIALLLHPVDPRGPPGAGASIISVAHSEGP